MSWRVCPRSCVNNSGRNLKSSTAHFVFSVSPSVVLNLHTFVWRFRPAGRMCPVKFELNFCRCTCHGQPLGLKSSPSADLMARPPPCCSVWTFAHLPGCPVEGRSWPQIPIILYSIFFRTTHPPKRLQIQFAYTLIGIKILGIAQQLQSSSNVDLHLPVLWLSERYGALGFG